MNELELILKTVGFLFSSGTLAERPCIYRMYLCYETKVRSIVGNVILSPPLSAYNLSIYPSLY